VLLLNALQLVLAQQQFLRPERYSRTVGLHAPVLLLLLLLLGVQVALLLLLLLLLTVGV
jgi:hypothetical protein